MSELCWQTPKGSSPCAYLRRAEDLKIQVPYARSRRAAVQAGGHIGVYPQLLAAQFERVYTFEPELENFRCLVQNCQASNIYAARGIVSDTHGCVELRISKGSGGHSVGGAGAIPAWRIDDLQLSDCDAIFLDVEGTEIPALRGAAETITRTHPLLVVEENKKLHGKGHQFGDIEKLMAPLGYKVVARVGEDLVLL